MRPERARRFQASYPTTGFERVPRAANDNVPAAGTVARRIFARPLMLGVVAVALVVVLGWLGRGGQAF